MAQRQNFFSAALKAKVALEALAGEATLAALSARHKVHPNLITKWKRRAAEGMVDVFSGKPGRPSGTHVFLGGDNQREVSRSDSEVMDPSSVQATVYASR